MNETQLVERVRPPEHVSGLQSHRPIRAGKASQPLHQLELRRRNQGLTTVRPEREFSGLASNFRSRCSPLPLPGQPVNPAVLKLGQAEPVHGPFHQFGDLGRA